MRLLKRAHHAVVAEIVGRQELEASRPPARARLAGAERLEPAANLGRQNEALARQRAHRLADPKLAPAVAVEGRGIEQADAGVVGRAQDGLRLVIGDRRAEAAERPATQAELGDLERRAAELAPGAGIVAHVSSLRCLPLRGHAISPKSLGWVDPRADDLSPPLPGRACRAPGDAARRGAHSARPRPAARGSLRRLGRTRGIEARPDRASGTWRRSGWPR